MLPPALVSDATYPRHARHQQPRSELLSRTPVPQECCLSRSETQVPSEVLSGSDPSIRSPSNYKTLPPACRASPFPPFTPSFLLHPRTSSSRLFSRLSSRPLHDLATTRTSPDSIKTLHDVHEEQGLFGGPPCVCGRPARGGEAQRRGLPSVWTTKYDRHHLDVYHFGDVDRAACVLLK